MATNVKKIVNIQYMAPIESISRKFALRKEIANQSGLIPCKFFGGMVKTSDNVKVGNAARNLFFMRKYGRSSAATTKELANRGRFATVAAATRARMKDLGTLTQDQLNYEAQYNTANGKKSFYGYLFDLEAKKYDQEHS